MTDIIVSSPQNKQLADLRQMYLADAGDNLRQALRLMTSRLSATSHRNYSHTITRWREYCKQQHPQINPADLSADHVLGYLDSLDLARSTKQTQLTHLRVLAQALHTSDVRNVLFDQNYKQLCQVGLPKDGNNPTGKTRERKSLAPAQVFEALRHWPQNTLTGIRNRALLAVLFYAGLRRSEAVALRWDDMDFEQGLITVRHGKGDKARTVPFAGKGEAIAMLKRWRDQIPTYEHVFISISKGDKLGADKPISTEAVRLICKASGDFKPHDARRTLITNALAAGTSVADAQFMAGHANPSTTLGYAVIKDANEVKGRLKLPY